MAIDDCTVCKKSEASICNRCKSARYCSKACQLSDCHSHELLCDTFSEFDQSTRPSSNHFLAFFFPVGDNKPKIVWLDTSAQDFDRLEAILGVGGYPEHYPLHDTDLWGSDLTDAIYVCDREGSPLPEENACIAAITASQPGLRRTWRDSAIAYGKVGLGDTQETFRDLSMVDYYHITRLFFKCQYQPMPVKVKGVRINCPGYVQAFNKPHFEEVEVELDDPIFSNGDVSPIADRIGIPILTRRCENNPDWERDPDLLNNQDATSLHLCIDRKAKVKIGESIWGRDIDGGWSHVPPRWQGSAGSILVVRQDKKRLSASHMKALCKFTRDDCLRWLGHSMREYHPDEPLSKDAVLAMISRPMFTICWYKLEEQVHAENRPISTWSHYGSDYPYDV